MQKTMSKKILSLALTFMLVLSVLSVIQLSTVKAAAGTFEPSLITFAASGTSATTDGLTIDYVADGPIANQNYIRVAVDVSGTPTSSGKFTIGLDGTSSVTGAISATEDFWAQSGVARGGRFLVRIFGNALSYNDETVSDLQLTLTFTPDTVYKTTSPADITLNGQTISLGFYPIFAPSGEEIIPFIDLSGSPSAAGQYTFCASSAETSGAKYVTLTTAELAENFNLYDWDSESFTMPAHDVSDFEFTATFVPDSNTNSSSKSSSSPNSSYSAPVQTPDMKTSANVSADGSVNTATALSDVNKALKDANNNGAVVKITNAEKITPETLTALAKAEQKAGKPVTVNADTVGVDGKVEARLTINPSDFKDVKSPINLQVKTTGTITENRKSLFERFFDNKVSVVSCSQKGSFGADVKMAVKVELPKDTSQLKLYSFDSATGKYSEIKTTYTIDKNGFLKFTTNVGGDIVISDKPLKKK